MSGPPKHPLAAGGNLPPRPPAKSSKGMASKVVTLTGVGVVSLLLIGYCAAQNDYEEVGAECVDMNSRLPDGTYAVVDEDYCDDDTRTYYHGSRGAYGWYYGGVRSGTRIRQGTTVRPSDVRITTPKGSVIQRGGFGGRGSSGS